MSDLTNLNVLAHTYFNSDEIKIGNGVGLSIKHFGTSHILSPFLAFKLFIVLHVPTICKNLGFFCPKHLPKTLIHFLSFTSLIFLLKDHTMGKLLHRGPSKHGLYPFFLASNKLSTSSALVGEHTLVS
jgi:hypothetical protein